MSAPRREWDAVDNDVLLILWHNGRDARWIARFMCCEPTTIYRRGREMGIAFGRRHRWTRSEDAMLRARYPGERTATVARALGLSVVQVHQHANALGLGKNDAFRELDRQDHSCQARTDLRMRVGRFKRGHQTWNKGKTGWDSGGRSHTTRFKKGQMSGAAQHNYVPIGSERISKDGYVERKVTDDPTIVPARRWVGVHRLVWEAAHGPIPRGSVVWFKPGMHTQDPTAITADMLECITQAESMRRNSYHNRYPKDVARLIQLRGALNRKIHRIERKQA